MYLLGSHVPDIDVPAISQQILKFVADFGGSEIKEAQLGKKKLAYPIKKEREGIYMTMDYSGKSSVVPELEKILRYDERVLRFITTKVQTKE